MALREKYSLLPQRNGLTEKRKVIIGYVHLEMLTSIRVECGELSKVYWFNYKYNCGLLGGFCYCNTIYLTADRSQQKSLNRAGTKLTENFGLMLTIYMGRMFH